MTLLVVVALIGLLEFSKSGWHGRWQRSYSLQVLHAMAVVALVNLTVPPRLAVGVGIPLLLPLLASIATFDAKRAGRWYGMLFSALSSWPVEVAALWGRPWWVWALAAPVGWLPWLLLRPKHWGYSFWDPRRWIHKGGSS